MLPRWNGTDIKQIYCAKLNHLGRIIPRWLHALPKVLRWIQVTAYPVIKCQFYTTTLKLLNYMQGWFCQYKIKSTWLLDILTASFFHIYLRPVFENTLTKKHDYNILKNVLLFKLNHMKHSSCFISYLKCDTQCGSGQRKTWLQTMLIVPHMIVEASIFFIEPH